MVNVGRAVLEEVLDALTLDVLTLEVEVALMEDVVAGTTTVEDLLEEELNLTEEKAETELDFADEVMVLVLMMM